MGNTMYDTFKYENGEKELGAGTNAIVFKVLCTKTRIKYLKIFSLLINFLFSICNDA